MGVILQTWLFVVVCAVSLMRQLKKKKDPSESEAGDRLIMPWIPQINSHQFFFLPFSVCPWVLSCLLADLELVKLIWIGYVWEVLFVKYIVYIIIRSYRNVGFLIVLFLKRNRTRMKNHETLLIAVEYGFLIGMFLKGNKEVSQSPISGGRIKSRLQFFIWFLVQFVKY